MKKIVFLCFLLTNLNLFSQTLSDIQKQNARATGYAVIAAKNPGIDFSVYVVPWDGVNTLEQNANTQINPSWHAQCAIKGNYFDQPFDGTNFTGYSSVVTSQAQFDLYKSTGTQWWIVCSTLPAFSSAPNLTVTGYSPSLILKRNTNTGSYTQGVQTQLQDGTNNWFWGNYDDNKWIVSKGDHQQPKLTVSSNGNVGIGVSDPKFKLDIVGGGANGQTFASVVDRQTKCLVLNAGSVVDATTGRRMLTFNDFPQSNIDSAPTSFFGIEDRNDSNRLRHWAKTGSSSQFELNDKDQVNVLSVYEDGTNGFFNMPKPDSYVSIGGKPVWPIPHKFWVLSGTSKFNNDVYVDTKVGVGTTTPVSKIDLGNNFSDPSTFPNKITLWSNGANNYFGMGISDSSYDYFSQGQHRFFVGYNGNPGTEVFTIKPSGNAALQGKLEVKELKVTTTPTADFVFEEDYNLPKLEEVEKHIKEKKHLPEIASAKEMEKEGVNVGEFQIKLLQKIEELTLYTIEQNKKIEAQNKQILEQNQRIQKLEKKIK